MLFTHKVSLILNSIGNGSYSFIYKLGSLFPNTTFTPIIVLLFPKFNVKS